LKAKILLISSFIFISFLFFENVNAFMFWNQACGFPGTSGINVTVPNSSFLNITGSFSFEGWLKPTNSTNPTAQILLEKRTGLGANGYTIYLSSGRVAIRTNSITKVVGNTVLQNDRWTHIAATFNSSSDVFSIYINGSLDADSTFTTAEPVSNPDPVRIGSGNANSAYAGIMDELRLWRKALSATEVAQFRRTSLGASSGIYDSLVLSLTFQDKESEGPDFSLSDWSGYNNNGINNGVSAIDLSNRPSNTISLNECIELDGTNDHLSGPDNMDVSPVTAVTLEAWIFPRNISGFKSIIVKGTAGNYGLRLNGAVLNAFINGNAAFNATSPIPVSMWTHVAFTYNGISGNYSFYINGRIAGSGIIQLGLIINGSDSLYIGGTYASGNTFNGFIDEVRISNYVKPPTSINRFLYQSIDLGNEPDSGFLNVVYNLDGLAFDNADKGPRLNFSSNARFSHSGTIDNQPVSPINRADDLNFSEGFSLKTSNKRIPQTGFTGVVTDSFEICLNDTITDINVFVALNHTAEEELELYLISPAGESVALYLNQTLIPNGDNIVTIFDDQADSSVINNSRYVSYSPVVKPRNPLNTVFIGDYTGGTWKLLINDETGSGTGRVCAWGIQFNNSSTFLASLCLKVFMEGFYREEDSCVQDILTVKIRDDNAPHEVIGVYAETPDNNLIGRYNFPEAIYGESYYLHIAHRNSIETWSADPVTFDLLSGCIEYDFTVDPDAAYGSNEIQVDDIPLRFAMYGGDVNQSGSVDGTDLALVDNDAANFVVGYVVTDLTGDDVVDASDYAIADNNAASFIVVIRP